jgi:hypothetical protein
VSRCAACNGIEDPTYPPDDRCNCWSPVPANDPKREREGEMCEAAYRCRECGLPWLIFAVHGEPTDGVDDPRKCRFCEDGIGRRIR